MRDFLAGSLGEERVTVPRVLKSTSPAYNDSVKRRISADAALPKCSKPPSSIYVRMKTGKGAR